MGEQTKRPLRILCLHGYRQTGDSFREKTGAFRKILKKQAEFVFMTSPLSVPPFEDESSNISSGSGSGSGWWFSREDDYYKAQDESDCIKGFKDSLSAIEAAFINDGPFDGVLGFSQGGAMLGVICGMLQQGKLNFSFKFAIFVSSYRSRSNQHQELYNETIMIPTLHVYGEADQVIEQPMSIEFLKYFHEPQIIVHPGGHFIPASGAQKQSYMKFMEKIKQICL